MAGTNKIFKDLQDHAVNPPAGLFAKLWKKIRKQGAGDTAFDKAIDIPDSNPPTAIDNDKIFSALQSYTDLENTPPPFDFSKISEAVSGIKEEPVTQPQKRNNIFPLLYKIAAAAVITGIIIFIYYLKNSDKTSKQTENSVSRAISPSVQTDKDSIQTALQRTVPLHNENEEETVVVNHMSSYNGNFPKNFITKNVNSRILYNDFIYTLTSFTYKQMDNFLSDVKKDNRIFLDKYSYVNISDKMAMLLKKTAAVNRQDKPTRKARKLKNRLIKWKKKDEVNFDINMRRNPIDILDLSEFILKN